MILNGPIIYGQNQILITLLELGLYLGMNGLLIPFLNNYIISIFTDGSTMATGISSRIFFDNLQFLSCWQKPAEIYAKGGSQFSFCILTYVDSLTAIKALNPNAGFGLSLEEKIACNDVLAHLTVDANRFDDWVLRKVTARWY